MGTKGEQGRLSETCVMKTEISKTSSMETQQLRESSLINPMYLRHRVAIDEEKNILTEIKREDIGGLVNEILLLLFQCQIGWIYVKVIVSLTVKIISVSKDPDF